MIHSWISYYIKLKGLKEGVNTLFFKLLIDERAAKLSLAALSYPPLTLNS